MAEKKSREKREKEDRRRDRFWRFIVPKAALWACIRFGYSYEPVDTAGIEGPLLVVINHASAYDPIFLGVAFRDRPLTFVASEHLLRSKWGPFLDRVGYIIPHRKGARSSRTALVAMKRIKKGESVFLAAEGEQTWNGRPLPVMPYTGRLVKGSGATLVTYLIEGAYLSAPRWALSTRRGRVFGRPAGVYSPEVLKGMSDEEVEELIAKDLSFDTWEWQKSRSEGPVRYKCSKGGNAEGLERSVFTCPSCGAFGMLSSKGDCIGCSCGFSVRMSDTGFFEAGSPFETAAEWEEADRAALKKRLDSLISGDTNETTKGAERAADSGRAAGEDIVFTDDCVVLHRIGVDHSDEEAARGRLTLSFTDDRFTLSVGDLSFDLADLSGMTMVLANRIVFSDNSGYYEVLADKKKRTNLRKYVVARDLIKGD